MGRLCRKGLERVDSDWDESPFLSQVVSLSSLAQVVLILPLLIFCVVARVALSWYGETRLGIRRVRFRDCLAQAVKTFFSFSA